MITCPECKGKRSFTLPNLACVGSGETTYDVDCTRCDNTGKIMLVKEASDILLWHVKNNPHDITSSLRCDINAVKALQTLAKFLSREETQDFMSLEPED